VTLVERDGRALAALVELRELAQEHASARAVATMTVVRPELPFGVAALDASGRVTGFHERRRAEHWVNGGFFACAPRFTAHLGPDLCSSASRSSASPPTAACTPTGTRASGPAWTRTRTPCGSTTCGLRGTPPWRHVPS